MLPEAITAQDYPPGFPRPGTTKVLENDRVIVWDTTWHKGEATPMHLHSLDYLSVTLAQGTVKVTERDGRSTVGPPAPVGFVRFNRNGIVHIEEGVSDQPRHAIMVELKPGGESARAPAEDLPGMFPRKGVVKLLENERVSVWDFTWTPGQQIPRYRQYRDTVIVYLKGGVIRWARDRQSASDTTKASGDVTYAPAEEEPRAEEVIEGVPRAIFIEIK